VRKPRDPGILRREQFFGPAGVTFQHTKFLPLLVFLAAVLFFLLLVFLSSAVSWCCHLQLAAHASLSKK